MKRILFLLLSSLLTVSACKHASIAILDKAEQLADNYPDSALTLLKSVCPDSLTDEADRARYGLLLAEASHGAGIMLINDSLISLSQHYYERQTNDKNRYTRALLHHGIALYYLQQTEDAVTLLKQAEAKADNSDDYNLRFLIYSVLGDVNDNIDNYATAIAYYRQALFMAQQSGNTTLQVRALNNLNTTLKAIGQHNEAQEAAIVISAQTQFDHIKQQQQLLHIIIWLLTALLLVIATTLGFVLYHRRRIARLHMEIDQLIQRYMSWHIDEELLSATLVTMLHHKADRGQPATDEDWNALQQLIRQDAPEFLARLNATAALTPKEQNVCLLIRLRFLPSELAVLTSTSPQTITNMRVRLLQKLFHEKGGARQFDQRMQKM